MNSGSREAANNRSKAVLAKHGDIKKSISKHSERLGKMDQALEEHKKHIRKNSPGPGHHQISKMHLKDIEKFTEELEETISELSRICKQLKSLSSDAHSAHDCVMCK
jgi:hypothetical protein